MLKIYTKVLWGYRENREKTSHKSMEKNSIIKYDKESPKTLRAIHI